MTDEADAMKGMAKALAEMIDSGFIGALCRGEVASDKRLNLIGTRLPTEREKRVAYALQKMAREVIAAHKPHPVIYL